MIYKDQAYHIQEKKMIDLTKKQLKAIKKDKKLIYIDGKIFERISYLFKKSNKSVYNIYNGKLEGVSPKKFEKADYYTFKNKQGVFYLKKNDNAKGKDKKYNVIRIEEADNKSFKSLKQLSSYRCTYDKNSLFREDERLPLVRSKNLRLITQKKRTSDSLIFILVSNVDGYWLIGIKSLKPCRVATSEYLGKTFPYKLLNME